MIISRRTVLAGVALSAIGPRPLSPVEARTSVGDVRLEGLLPASARSPGDAAVLIDEAARARINRALAAGHDVVPSGRRDRWGRVVGDVVTAEGGLSALLVEEGLALADPGAATPDTANRLISAEMIARRNRAGLWADARFGDVPSDDAWPAIGCFASVVGAPTAAAEVRGRMFLNFGDDYRRDFTATVEPADRRAAKLSAEQAQGMVGAIVRIRGWVELWNGPLVRIRRAGQVRPV